MRKLSLLLLAGCIAGASSGQTKMGNNPTTINANALLEMESTNKGILLPRVALTGTTSASPLSAFTAGMVVYNTATAGTTPNNVVPGLYISDGAKWVRLLPENAVITNGFWGASGNSGTTSSNFLGNTDNTDFVMRTNNTERFRLTKAGSLYGGYNNNYMPDTALYGLAWGYKNLASRNYSTAIGYSDTVSGAGNGAWAIGYKNNALGDRSVAMGTGNQANATYGIAIGNNTAANAYNMMAAGTYNAIDSTASGTGTLSKDPIFTVGNGTSTTRGNALNVVKSGQVLINTSTSGVTGYAAPRADLDVRGTGGVIWSVGTTANRPVTPVQGMVRFNTDSKKFEGFDGTAWFNMD